jgi:hypothetical protein
MSLNAIIDRPPPTHGPRAAADSPTICDATSVGRPGNDLKPTPYDIVDSHIGGKEEVR